MMSDVQNNSTPIHLNWLWINKDVPENGCAYLGGTLDNTKKILTSCLEANRGYDQSTLWYLGAQMHPAAVEKTKQLLAELQNEQSVISSPTKRPPIILRKLESIPAVSDNLAFFTSDPPGSPQGLLYCLVDVCKLIVLEHSLKEARQDSMVTFSDLFIEYVPPKSIQALKHSKQMARYGMLHNNDNQHLICQKTQKISDVLRIAINFFMPVLINTLNLTYKYRREKFSPFKNRRWYVLPYLTTICMIPGLHRCLNNGQLKVFSRTSNKVHPIKLSELDTMMKHLFGTIHLNNDVFEGLYLYNDDEQKSSPSEASYLMEMPQLPTKAIVCHFVPADGNGQEKFAVLDREASIRDEANAGLVKRTGRMHWENYSPLGTLPAWKTRTPDVASSQAHSPRSHQRQSQEKSTQLKI